MSPVLEQYQHLGLLMRESVFPGHSISISPAPTQLIAATVLSRNLESDKQEDDVRQRGSVSSGDVFLVLHETREVPEKQWLPFVRLGKGPRGSK